jgi:hypothetical protein
MTVYKSVPTVTTNDQLSNGVSGGSGSLTGNLSVADVYKFQVTADSKGDIGLFRVSFLVTTSSATVTKLYLHDGSSYVAATTTFPQVLTDSDQGDTVVFTLQFTSDGLAPAGGANNNKIPYTIDAGVTKTFTLKADITCGTSGKDCSGTSGNGSISFQLLGDGSFPSTYPDNARTLQAVNYENDFIWTDFAISGALGTASSTASTAEQWTNGYRVASAAGKLSPTSTAVTLSK